MLVTLARSKVTSSDNARLVPWTTLPSMQRLNPSGLMISPQSCATVNLRAHLASAAVDLDLADGRHNRTRAPGIGDATPGRRVAVPVGPRRQARLHIPPEDDALFISGPFPTSWDEVN